MHHDTNPFTNPEILHPSLAAELDAAEAWQRDHDLAAPAAVSGIAAAVREKTSSRESELSDDAEVWAEGSLFVTRKVLLPLEKHGLPQLPDVLFNIPGELEKYAPTLNRLYHARQTLIDSGEQNQQGINIGESMKLIAVPWQGFRDNLDTLQDWMEPMRIEQRGSRDMIRPLVLDAIVENKPMYNSYSDSAPPLTAKEYLDKKIAEDGPWGFMLMQMSNTPGTSKWPDSDTIPDSITERGQQNPEIAGVPVGNMGVFEWLALTLHKKPELLSKEYGSTLLANRFEGDDNTHFVPVANRNTNGDLRLSFVTAEVRLGRGQPLHPRLAVA